MGAQVQAMVRQGDLLFVGGATVPAAATVVADGVVVRGVVTGHTHAVRAGTGTVRADGADLYVEVASEAQVDHPEHATVTLGAGAWRVVRQREYRPDGWQQVAD